MGGFPCGQNTVHDQSKKYQIHEDDVLDSNEKEGLSRKGKPSRKIAVSINDLKNQKISEKEYYMIQEKINKMIQLDKHKLKPLKLTRRRRVANQLKDPYYIPSLNAIYIGEWVYHKRIDDNLPEGIGRLYFDDELYEGELASTLIGHRLSPDQIQQIQHNNVLREKYKNQESGSTSRRNMESADLLHYKSADANQDARIQSHIDEDNRIGRKDFIIINVLLEGAGRKISKSALESGFFMHGKLIGKGKIQIKEIEYEYNGELKDGIKNGKGVQITKAMTYDGDFVDGKKHGKGLLIFKLDPAYEKEREQEDAKLNMRLTPELNEQIEKSIKQKAQREEVVREALKPFRWDPQAQPQQTIFEDSNFIVEHHFRKKFTQKYVGQFRQDVFQGKGVYEWFNGKVFNGEWRNGKINGYGEFYWPSGAIYRGYYVNDLKQGKGQMIWCQTKRYRGQWFQGIRHGYGQIINIFEEQNRALLSIQGGVWVKDKLDKVYFMKIVQLGHSFDFMQIQSTRKILLSVKHDQ